MKVLFFSRDYTPHDYRFLRAITENGDDVYYLRLETRNVYESRPLPESVHIVDWEFGKGPFDVSKDAESAAEALKKVFETIRPDVIHSGPLTDCSYITAKAGLHPHTAMSWALTSDGRSRRFREQRNVLHLPWLMRTGSSGIAMWNWIRLKNSDGPEIKPRSSHGGSMSGGFLRHRGPCGKSSVIPVNI